MAREHAIAIDREGFEKEMERLTSLGFYFASKGPFLGGGGCRVAFMHPKSTNGVLVELSQHIEPKKA